MSTPDLHELEEVLVAHPDVLEVAAVALEDGPRGTRLGVTAVRNLVAAAR